MSKRHAIPSKIQCSIVARVSPQVDLLTDAFKPCRSVAGGLGAVAYCHPVTQLERLHRKQEETCRKNSMSQPTQALSSRHLSDSLCPLTVSQRISVDI